MEVYTIMDFLLSESQNRSSELYEGLTMWKFIQLGQVRDFMKCSKKILFITYTVTEEQNLQEEKSRNPYREQKRK